MQSHEAVVKVVTILCEAYPTWGGRVTRQTYEVWTTLLADVPPAELVRAAVQHTQTSQFPPTVADLRRLAKPALKLCAGEAFDLAQRASEHASPYDAKRCDEARAALARKDPAAAEALRVFGGFSAFWSMTSATTARAQFRDIYEAIQQRAVVAADSAVATAALEGFVGARIDQGRGPRPLLDRPR